MIAQGIDVVSFAVGEPDFDTPANIREAAIKAINEGFTRYTPATGIPALKEAIVKKFREDNGLDYAVDEVIASVGGKQAIFNAIQALCDDGDEVLMPAPYWVSYPEMVKLAGGVPVIVPTGGGAGFKCTPEILGEYITPKTSVIILNSPSNPTGAVYSKDEIEDLAAYLLDKGIAIISDEIYEELIYDGMSHYSIAQVSPEAKANTVVTNGVSKAYAMTGWRIGYAAGPSQVIKAMGSYQGHCTSNPTSISQVASVEALTGPKDTVREMVAEFSRRRDYLVERVSALPGFRMATVPGGAFYLFPDVTGLYGRVIGDREIGTDMDLAEVILEKAHVALVPGVAFGAPGHLRLSYAASMEELEKGADRLEELVT